MPRNTVNKCFNSVKLLANSQPKPKADETGLNPQKRAMIATYVAYLHDAFFGQGSTVQNHAFREYAGQPAHLKLKALISTATTYALSIGATNREVQDTVVIPSVLINYQRSIDAVVSKPTEPIKDGKSACTTPVISIKAHKKETA